MDQTIIYTESDSKIGQWQGGAPNLSQAKPTPKQLNLHKLSDAGGLKGGGCPTQPEPIFESRAVYLDNHLATPPCSPALEEMRAGLSEYWQFCLPKEPLEAEDILRARYPIIYDLVGAASSDSFVFTSSGAEAVAQVHWSAFLHLARKEGKCHFVTSAVEDAPLLQSLKRLEDLGCYVKIAPLDRMGRIDVQKLSELVGPRTAMISISMAHGLTGVIQPIEEISQLAREKNAYLHVDASYALGKLLCPMQQFDIDYLTFSGDRIHGVKSSGGLFAKEGRPLSPFVLEEPLDVPSLLALAVAARHASLCLDQMGLEVALLRNRLEEALVDRLGAKVLFRDTLRLPNVAVVAFPQIHQESLLYALQQKQLFASIGGMCMPPVSHHLMACGYDERFAQTAMSFCLSRLTTQVEIDRAVEIITGAALSLRPLTEDLRL